MIFVYLSDVCFVIVFTFLLHKLTKSSFICDVAGRPVAGGGGGGGGWLLGLSPL